MKPTYEELQSHVEVLREKGRLLVVQAERALDFDVGNHHALKGSAYALDNALDSIPASPTIYADRGQNLCVDEIRAQAVRKFVSDTIETGEFGWSDCQCLETWCDEWLEEQAKKGSDV
jgi:hypothetical protein